MSYSAARRADEPAKAILLDALGTLIELEPPGPFLRAELRARFEVEISELDAQLAVAAEIAFYRRHLDEGRDRESLAALRRECAAALRDALPAAARHGLPAADALVDALLASLRFRLYPDVRPALAAYRERGRRLVVVSNWDVSLHAVLRNLGIASVLDGVITSAEIGVRKPDPAIFREALQLAGAVASDAVHVGDSLEEDVAGARAAGVAAVLVRRDGGSGPDGVQTISSLAHPIC